MSNKFFEKLQKLPKPVSVVGLILFIVLLYVTLQKGITPLVMKVVSSDLFFEKDEEQEELGKISSDRGIQAFAHCKNILVAEKHVPEGSQFMDKDYEAWALGGRTYLIRSHVSVTTPENGTQDRKYACKIKYLGGDINDAKSWDALGVDFNEPN